MHLVCVAGRDLKSYRVYRKIGQRGRRRDCSSEAKEGWVEAMAALLPRPSQKRTTTTQGPARTSILLLRKSALGEGSQ